MEKFNVNYQHLRYDEFMYEIEINCKNSTEERLFQQIITVKFENVGRIKLHKMREAILDFNPIDKQIKSMLSDHLKSINDALCI
jgi:hypothetical protein